MASDQSLEVSFEGAVRYYIYFERLAWKFYFCWAVFRVSGNLNPA